MGHSVFEVYIALYEIIKFVYIILLQYRYDKSRIAVAAENNIVIGISHFVSM